MEEDDLLSPEECDRGLFQGRVGRIDGVNLRRQIELEKRRRERELNLEFCVCVFNEAGDVESPCQAHIAWVDELRKENKRLRGELKRVSDNARVMGEEFEDQIRRLTATLNRKLNDAVTSPLLEREGQPAVVSQL